MMTSLRNWKIETSKVLYTLVVTFKDELLQHIKNTKIPKETWDNLVAMSQRTNDVKLGD